MATAVKESIDKSFKYLDKFISVLKNGEDVLFAKEKVASKRVYKDGEKVKKIIAAFDAFVDWSDVTIKVLDRDETAEKMQTTSDALQMLKDKYAKAGN